MPSLPATKQSKAAKAVAARAAAERQASNQSAEASALGRRGRPMGSDSDIGGTSRTNQQNVRNVCIGWAHLYDPYKPHPTSDFTPRGWAGRGGGDGVGFGLEAPSICPPVSVPPVLRAVLDPRAGCLSLTFFFCCRTSRATSTRTMSGLMPRLGRWWGNGLGRRPAAAAAAAPAAAPRAPGAKPPPRLRQRARRLNGRPVAGRRLPDRRGAARAARGAGAAAAMARRRRVHTLRH